MIITPWDEKSVDFVKKIGVKAFKIASIDANNYHFCEYVAKQKIPTIISTGMCTYNELKITLGSKSEGIFKSPKPVVLVEYSNPYVSTTGMQNVVIKNDLKFYDRKTFWLGVGFVSGIGTSI